MKHGTDPGTPESSAKKSNSLTHGGKSGEGHPRTDHGPATSRDTLRVGGLEEQMRARATHSTPLCTDKDC